MSKKIEYTSEKTASIIKKSTATLSRWRRFGVGPAYIKRGGQYYYQKSEIDRWMKEGD